jgi:hypothetical protein
MTFRGVWNMAKRRDIEGKKGKHGREGSEYYEELSRRRSRNRIIIASLAAVVLVLILVTVFLLLEPPSEDEDEKDILSTTTSENSGQPSDAIKYSATIYNPDKDLDVFSTLISDLPPDWTVDIPTTISVEGKKSKTTEFTVMPSPESALNKTYSFTLTITSGNTQQSNSIDYSITIFHALFGVELYCYNSSHDADPGRLTSYALLLRNTGNGEDTMTLSYIESYLPANWSLTFEYDSISIPAHEYRVVICTIDTHENSSKGRYDIIVKATASNGFSSEIWLNTSLVKDFLATTVAVGDKLQVDYIGMFPEGHIFDTSVFDAANNSDLPKTSEFQMRPSYSPLRIYVGPNDPNTEDDYTAVITGFWEGVVGLKVDETTVVRFPSSKGYDDGKWRLFEIKVISIDG